MPLRVKCVSYDTVNVSTLYDLEVLTEDLRLLITSGYELTLEVFTTNNSNQGPWRLLGISRRNVCNLCEHRCETDNSTGNNQHSTVLNMV